jgi:hypothetical protein
MPKYRLGRSRDAQMEDTDLLPSIKVIRFRFLQGWRTAHRAREDVITRLFQQKPGTQLFFFRKIPSPAAQVSQEVLLFSNKSLVCSFSSFEKPHHRLGSLPGRSGSVESISLVAGCWCGRSTLWVVIGAVSQFTLGQSCRRTGRNHVNEWIGLESSTEVETYGYPVERPRSGGSAFGSRPPIPSSGRRVDNP